MNPVAATRPEASPPCPLCRGEDGGTLLWTNDRLRVVLVEQFDSPHVFPGFCRVIWNAHVAEMSDLAPADREHLMAVVLALESVLRGALRPDKVNLASLGNQVPHLHWHVIPRFVDDSHFPRSIWDLPLRATPDGPQRDKRLAQAGMIGTELTRLLGPSAGPGFNQG